MNSKAFKEKIRGKVVETFLTDENLAHLLAFIADKAESIGVSPVMMLRIMIAPGLGIDLDDADPSIKEITEALQSD